MELQARLERQHEAEANGRDMGIAIRTTNQEVETLTKELRRRREDCNARRSHPYRHPGSWA